MCPTCGLHALKAGYGCTICDYLVAELADKTGFRPHRLHTVATKLMQARHEAAANAASWRETLRIERDAHLNAERLKLEYKDRLDALKIAVNKFLDGRMEQFPDSRFVDDDLVELALAVSA